MRKSLATVIRLQRWQVDAHRRRVSEADAQVRALQLSLNALARLCDEEKRCAREAIETGSFAFGAFLQRIKTQRAALEAQQADAEIKLAQARQRLADAYREQRKFELAEAEQRRRKAEEQTKKDQQVLDEMAITRHSRTAAAGGFGDD